ncbi:glutamate-5-semialdehyde dehydrogenase [Phocea massiliensis]|uniref:Gamma-glutamyl phosphate reductase n=1 Tax=Merdimmobilis hominis TaxID=2897707 RepID=A0A938X7Q0_9FIRM|nr:glutamate-5-semialdehyde dehydrogenase [Merdimmobilis hominis]MBM6921440.1 glutamate-5-semialdehyde dehydrogenase [Merdimmobilis hominis]
MSKLSSLAQRIKDAQPQIAHASTPLKNQILLRIANRLIESTDEILEANRADLSRASQNGIPNVMLDRLSLSEERIHAMANGVRKVAALADPIGEVLFGKTLPNGLVLRKQRVPLGVVGMIYESRPNVTVDAAALCLKTSNAVMLRGGKEAINTNVALVRIMQDAIETEGLAPNIIGLVEDTSRESATRMMQLNGYLDVLIPRGGAGLIQSVVKNATVPVIETGAGNCHIYIDKSADLHMGAEIVFNAKTSRPSVCNACESLLVHERVAESFLPLVKSLLDTKNVIMLGCEKTRAILKDIPPATESDYAAEFLGYVISVKVVSSIDEAISHINRYSTHHSEAIITNDIESASKFTERVDSAAVYVNASTRFTDGEEFGFGAEIGISTQKLHARGPMGLNEMTSAKYIIYGTGQVR